MANPEHLSDREIDKYTLDPKIKKMWLDALRSGEYEQGRGHLKQPIKDFGEADTKFCHCCLGVLGELLIKEELFEDLRWDLGDDGREYDTVPDMVYKDHKSAEFLPAPLSLELGLERRVVSNLDQRAVIYLADMNDSGRDFLVIADWIEDNL